MSIVSRYFGQQFSRGGPLAPLSKKRIYCPISHPAICRRGQGVFKLFGPSQNYKRFARLIATTPPAAKASIKGDKKHPGLHGAVYFYPEFDGTLVVAELYGLPYDKKQPRDGRGPNPGGFLGFHIHEGGACTGNDKDPFADAGMHLNPQDRPHPLHMGDMPPLLSNEGYAYLAFFTDRFTVPDIIGKTVIIHSHSDDFESQPSGDAGTKIACGIIRKN
ncbi:MAG: superoxide dismutase family protein [Clostridiales bacterium]|nr:superoxide dismutase family protein [Clostridiales bacterium]